MAGDASEDWVGGNRVAELLEQTEAAGEARGLGVASSEGRLAAAAAAATAAVSTEGSPPAASRARLAAASLSLASSIMGSTERGLADRQEATNENSIRRKVAPL